MNWWEMYVSLNNIGWKRVKGQFGSGKIMGSFYFKGYLRFFWRVKFFFVCLKTGSCLFHPIPARYDHDHRFNGFFKAFLTKFVSNIPNIYFKTHLNHPINQKKSQKK